MQKKLYTFIVDFEGGTYISQWSARSPREAMARWARDVDLHVLLPATKRNTRERFVDDVDAERPTKVAGTRGVWCITSLLGNGVAITHIVETAVARRLKK